jgi:hypothetical protein
MPGELKLKLNVTHLIASAAATVTATVAASYFGVAGTLIGAGAVSMLSTVGAAIYQHFLDRGREQIVAKIPARVAAGGSRIAVRADGEDGDSGDPASTGRMGGRPWPKWYVLIGAAAGIFLVVMGLVTAFELFTGRPLSNTVQGRAGQGTSVHPALTGVRPTPGSPASDEATPATTTAPSTAPTPERTPQTTPTPYPSGTSEPAPGQRPSPTGASTGPIGTPSPPPQQPSPPDVGRGNPDGNTGAWHTP